MSGDENDLARDFGFDISMPDGNVGLPSAAHKMFMDQCQALYREFMANMSQHIKTEKELRLALKQLHEEKIRNMRFSLYRSESTDPFARKQEIETPTTPFPDSRVNTPWGLDIIPDVESHDGGYGDKRPQTAPAGGAVKRKGLLDARPKTAGVANNDHEADDESNSGLSDVTAVSESTVVGIIDKKSEQSSSRKITVGSQSFSKITHSGNIRAKLKHKDGRFIVKPVKIDVDVEHAPATTATSSSDTTAYDPAVAKHQFDPASERMALVRKITSFKTPTISSDMKINNRVPIQRRLRGLEAKRTTVSEIYQNARDRRTRHFRIVANKPDRSKSALGLTDGRTFRKDLSQRWVNALSSSCNVGKMTILAARSSLDAPEPDPSRPRSILQMNSSKSLGESINSAKEMADNMFLNVFQDVTRRPASRVAFARTDSQLSDNVFVNDENADPNSTTGSSSQCQYGAQNGAQNGANDNGTNGSQFGKRLLQQPNGRSRTDSTDNDPRQRAGSFTRAERPGNNADTSPRVSKLGDNLNRRERHLSASSSGTAASYRHNLRQQAGEGGKAGGPADGKPGTAQNGPAVAPGKMDSRRDTVRIVKQQMKMDKELDSRITVWRQRMAVKSAALGSKMRGSPRRGKVM